MKTKATPTVAYADVRPKTQGPPPPWNMQMTADGLRDWQTRMGWTQLEAAQALGMSLATYKRMFADGPSRLQWLACKALEAGLGNA